METEIKVSVIVPVYNAEQYLDQCLEALTNQSLEGLEIICVDNCSTDHSRDIISQWASLDHRIKPIFNPTNIGQGGSMNVGLDNAMGEYIAECDADDWVELNAYETMYIAAKAVDADVIRCNVVKHYNGIEEMYRNGGPSIYNICFKPMSLDHQTLQCVIGRWCCIPAGLYKRQFIISNNIWYRLNTQFEDNSLSFKIRTTADRYMYIPQFLYHYRMDNPTSGTATIVSVDGIFEQFAEIQRFAEGKGLDNIITAWKFYIYRWAYGRLKDDEARLQFLGKCRNEFEKDTIPKESLNSEEDWELYNRIKRGDRI